MICQQCGKKFEGKSKYRARCYECLPKQTSHVKKQGQNICAVCDKKSFLKKGQKYCRSCETAISTLANRIRSAKYMGGKCQECGLECDYQFNLGLFDFHHVKEKNFELSSVFRQLGWDKIQNELDKCQMLCAFCHRKIHNTPIPDKLFCRAMIRVQKSNKIKV